MTTRCGECGCWYSQALGACDCFVGGVEILWRWFSPEFWAEVARMVARKEQA